MHRRTSDVSLRPKGNISAVILPCCCPLAGKWRKESAIIAYLCADPSVATAALRQKKAHENELDRIAGTRLTLETQVNAIESANLNAETMLAMKKGADALKGIHSSLCVLRPG